MKLIILLSLLLTGCASVSTPIAMSGGEYVVSARATWELGGRSGAKRMTYEAAMEQCRGPFKIVRSNADYNHFEGGTVELTFTCENHVKN